MRLQAFVLMAAVTAGAVALAGCGGGGSSSGFVGSTGSSVSSQTGIVGPAGGSVTNADGDEVDIPAGDLATATAVSIGPGSAVAVAGYTPVGAPVEFTPNGASFASPARVTVKFDTALIPAGKSAHDIVVIRREANGTTTPLAQSSVDPATGKVAAMTGSFCTFEPEVGTAANLAITTASLPGGTVGAPYSATIAATGGATPYTFRVAKGTLPAGLSIAASGAISGTPSSSGTTAILFGVTDAAGATDQKALSFTIAPSAGALAITTASLPNGSVGAPYAATLQATGGTQPYAWSMLPGPLLPAGLGLDPATGVISGTPSAPSSFSATFVVTDAAGATDQKVLSFTIAPAGGALKVTTSALPKGTIGNPYRTTLTASGGTPAYTWSVVSGAPLPPGITLDPATGVLSGTPTVVVTVILVLGVADSAGATAQSSPMSLVIGPGIASLQVTTASLPSGDTSTPYSATLTATGGTPPYSWDMAPGSDLPLGLTLDAVTGEISGTPGAVTTTTLVFEVTDGAGTMAQSAPLTLDITAGGGLQVTTASLPVGTVGAAYNVTLDATGGTGPYTWSIVPGPVLPAGLGLDPATGQISGTPTVASTDTFVFVVTDSTGATAQSAALTLTIAPAGTFVVTTASLPGGTVGIAYSFTLGATGGAAPYTWAVTFGTLTTGLSLDPATGVISGTPSAPDNATLVFEATDTTGATADSASLVLTILPGGGGLQVTTASLPSGTVGVAYTTTLQATGGTGPYTWSIVPGPTLPAGLALDPSTGDIGGTPSVAGSDSFVFVVTDSTGATAQSAPLTLTILPGGGGLQVTTTTLPDGTVGVAYSATLQATGGAAPYTWSVTSMRSLPAGLTLDPATGDISGTPSAAGSVPLIFEVKDSAGAVAQAGLTLTILPAGGGLQVTTATLPDGTEGVAYTTTLAATGGTAPYSWEVAGGALPAGLALDAATGDISGTPTVPGSALLVFKVTDSAGATALSGGPGLALTIKPAGGGLQVTTAVLPDATVGVAYGVTLTATGGTPPYTWSLTSGALTAGLSLDSSTGEISGTPSVTDTATLVFDVADSTGATASSGSLTLNVLPPGGGLQVTTASLPSGTVGAAYNVTLQASGGTPPYTWSLTSGALTAGLNLDPATGDISGTPTVPDNATLVFEVADSTGATAPSGSLTLVVTGGAGGTWTDLTTPALPSASAAFATAAVGSVIYTFGGLPAGSGFQAVDVTTLQATNVIWRYDTSAPNVAPEPASLPNAVAFAEAVAVGNVVYLFGGTDGVSQFASAQSYDTSTQTLASLPDMPATRESVAAAASDPDDIYVFGGSSFDPATFERTSETSIWQYKISTSAWTTVAVDMPEPIQWARAIPANGKIYILGGCDCSVDANGITVNAVYDAVLEFDPSVPTINAVAQLPAPAYLLAGDSVGSLIYVCGGARDQGQLPTAAPFGNLSADTFSFDPATGTVATLAPFQTNVNGVGALGGRCAGGAAAGANGLLYLIGGATAPSPGATPPFSSQGMVDEVATYQP